MHEPPAAISRYNTLEIAACEEYRQYWIEKFAKVGVIFQPEKWYGKFTEATHRGYRLHAEVNPSRYDGVKIEVHCNPNTQTPYAHWHTVKVKSENGFTKLIERLTSGDFK